MPSAFPLSLRPGGPPPPQVVLADYRCPEQPPQRSAMLDRLAAYMHCIAPASSGGGGSATAAAPAAANAQQQPSGAAVEADCEALAEVLRLYLTASQCSDDFEGLQMATDAAAMLAAPDRQAAIARALRHLAAAEAADEGAAGGKEGDARRGVPVRASVDGGRAFGRWGLKGTA